MVLKLLLMLVSVSVSFAASEREGGQTKPEVKIRLEKPVAKVGYELGISCGLTKPDLVKSCTYGFGGHDYNIDETLTKELNDKMYFDSTDGGFKKGHCSMKIKINEKYHGNITCKLTLQGDPMFHEASANLIVAKEPQSPKLTLSHSNDMLKEGAWVNATCVVAGGRPAARITWLYDGQDLRRLNMTIKYNNSVKTRKTKKGVIPGKTGSQNATEQAANEDESEDAIETVEWRASADDDGKELTCSASHESWDRQQTDSKKLAVSYKPILYVDGKKINKEELKFQGVKWGESKTITITVMSRSEPINVEWTIGENITLKPGSSEGNFKAAAQEKDTKSISFFVYKLTLINLTADELEQKYTFKVKNNEGTVSKNFTLSIEAPMTTKPKEPPVAEANFTLMIILYVVGVLFLVAIATVVYAKLKHKMCFASKPPVHTGQVVQPE